MANKFRSLLKVIVGGTGKHKFLESTSAVGSATGKVQETFNTMQNVAITKYNIFTKQINNEAAIILQDFKAASSERRNPLLNTVQGWWQWYQQLTGLDIVETSRQHVLLAEYNLFNCWEERRCKSKELININDKLRDIHGELISTRREDPKYVQLTIRENKFLQEHKKVMDYLNLLEKKESDCFTLLATANKGYHDSQTTNARKLKNLSVLVTVVVAFSSWFGSKIYHNREMKNMQNVIIEAQEKQENAVVNSLHCLNNELNAKFSEIREILVNNDTKKDDTKSNQGQGILAGAFYLVVKPVTLTASGIGAACSFIKRSVYG